MHTASIPWYKNLKPASFFLFWFIISLIQAAGTGLMDDEAYYWVYSRFLDWGYYDHPPMTALLIKAGTILFPGELGVRFFIILLNTLTLVIIHSLLSKKNDILFYWIALGMAVMQIGGILAVPDIPLIFFIACFFVLYRNFLRESNYKNAVFLGLAIAAMLYSKYHGVLIVVFTLLSNLAIIRKPQAWAAVLLALLCFTPHLVWQFQNGLPSIQYHLFERNLVDYKVGYTLEFIGGQLAFMGPFIGWLLLWAAWKQRPADKFESALKMNLFGILLFFCISSFRGRVEANWTIPVFVPLIVLAHQYLSTREKWWPFLKISAITTFALVFIVRIYLLADIEPLPWLKKDEFHKNAERAAVIKEQANGRPVVFINSYQAASKHWFYSGDTALSLNTFYYRRNNYNFWPIEDQFQQRAALILNIALPDDTLYGAPVKTIRGDFTTYNDPCFVSNMKGWIAVDGKKIDVMDGNKVAQTAQVTHLNYVNGSCKPADTHIAVLVYNKGKAVYQQLTDFQLPVNNAQVDSVRITTELPAPAFPNIILRYGLPTSIPGTFTLNSPR